MKTYKTIFRYDWNYENNDIGHSIARALYEYGIKIVRPSCHFIAGREDIDHIDIWMTSIVCEPCIKVLSKNKERPLLWAILDELDIRFSGGASEEHMQASFVDSNLLGYRVKSRSAKEIISSTCLYFDAIKRFKDGQ